MSRSSPTGRDGVARVWWWCAAAAAAAGIVVTTAAALRGEPAFAYRAPDLHLALETGEALVGLLAAFVVLGRLARRRRLDDALLAVGFTVLGLANLALGVGSDVGGDPSGAIGTWAAAGSRTIGAAFLAAAAAAPARRLNRTGAPAAAAVAASVIVGAVAVSVAALEDGLPVAVRELARPGGAAPALEAHPGVLVLQLVSLVLYTGAALGFARRARARADGLLRLLAVGCVFAAAARANYVAFPSVLSDYVSVGDVLRLAFYGCVLLGATFEIRSYWTSVAEVAALEERRRIARDLHDGLAQELASIGRNLTWADAGDPFVERARAASARALDEARRAIAALDGPWDARMSVALAETMRHVAEREAIHVDLELDGEVQLTVPERAAFVMIASEAVTNAARHSGAAAVAVELSGGADVRLRIADAGCGFDPSDVRPGASGYGLTSMRDRAAAIGATFRVESRPGHGTVVEVVR